MTKQNQNITWFQFNNWFPILLTVVSLTVSLGVVVSRIAIIETKLDIVITQQDKLIAKYSDVESRYGALALKVTALEAVNVLRK